ncbi:HAD family hydrolase [Macrococcus sp. EM39E]|uniref:HAD family hydrolase n=1 Tax=Macrococcus animalis TaxID=3395467 RepID=UPI0039BE244A
MKQIIFDVDGVFLSEERCFDVTAITVFELLYGKHYLDLSGDDISVLLTDEEIASIRRKILYKDNILRKLKDKGLNSNWDMLFIIFSIHLIELIKRNRSQFNNDFNHIDLKWLQEAKFSDELINYELPLSFISNVPSGKLEVYDHLVTYASEELQTDAVESFQLKSSLWNISQNVYQEWYLGEAYHFETSGKESLLKGKPGYLKNEVIIQPADKIKKVLDRIKEKGYIIGIATGRPRIETLVPFESFDLLSYFDENKIVTASEVLDAERMFPEHRPLGKPHPFCYLASYHGNNPSHYLDYINGECVEKSEFIIVGDSLADYYCAKAIGATFVATLTGVKGQSERSTFEDLQADYIIDDILDLDKIL